MRPAAQRGHGPARLDGAGGGGHARGKGDDSGNTASGTVSRDANTPRGERLRAPQARLARASAARSTARCAGRSGVACSAVLRGRQRRRRGRAARSSPRRQAQRAASAPGPARRHHGAISPATAGQARQGLDAQHRRLARSACRTAAHVSGGTGRSIADMGLCSPIPQPPALRARSHAVAWGPHSSGKQNPPRPAVRPPRKLWICAAVPPISRGANKGGGRQVVPLGCKRSAQRRPRAGA